MEGHEHFSGSLPPWLCVCGAAASCMINGMCEIEKTRLKHFLPPEHIQISYIPWIKSDFMENKWRKSIVTSRFDVPKARSPKKQRIAQLPSSRNWPNVSEDPHRATLSNLQWQGDMVLHLLDVSELAWQARSEHIQVHSELQPWMQSNYQHSLWRLHVAGVLIFVLAAFSAASTQRATAIFAAIFANTATRCPVQHPRTCQVYTFHANKSHSLPAVISTHKGVPACFPILAQVVWFCYCCRW